MKTYVICHIMAQITKPHSSIKNNKTKTCQTTWSASSICPPNAHFNWSSAPGVSPDWLKPLPVTPLTHAPRRHRLPLQCQPERLFTEAPLTSPLSKHPPCTTAEVRTRTFYRSDSALLLSSHDSRFLFTFLCPKTDANMLVSHLFVVY